MNVRPWVAAAALLLGACAPAAGPPRPMMSTLPAGSVLTQQEIAGSGGTTLYAVVQRLRPGWLTGRGVQNFGGRTGEVVVYLNETRLGDVQALREMTPEYVVSMHYLDASTAAGLPGIRPREIVGGAIVIYTPAKDPGTGQRGAAPFRGGGAHP